MNGAEELAKRLYEACLSGEVETLHALIQKDPLIVDRVSSTKCFFNETPLHVAVLRGHLEFTKALLTQKPGLATELDSQRCSPLHLASIEGHFEIVHELLRVNLNVCIFRDQDGRIPLQLAVMKGRVEVIGELLGANPDSVHCWLESGETLLHLSVKYNRLEALKTLVQYMQRNDMESLLNSRDDDGNSILHLAAALKQKDTIEYLLGIKSVEDHANDKNQNGSTALDVVEHCPNRDMKTMEIREILLQAGVHRSVRGGPVSNPGIIPVDKKQDSNPQCCAGGLLGWISWFWTTYLMVDHDWLKEIHGHLITTATLTATMAYQSMLSPPGGYWQETPEGQLAPSPSSGDSDHTAGQAIMDTNVKRSYIFYIFGGKQLNSYDLYLGYNTIILGASLSTIMLAMTGFPKRNKLLTWTLVCNVYITIACMAAAYAIGLTLVSPENTSPVELALLLLGGILLCTVVIVLQTGRFSVWLGKKLVKLVKACSSCSRPKPTQNSTGGRESMGNLNC